MFEFAISCGEGTLLDYGITDNRDSVIGDVAKSWAIEAINPYSCLPSDFDLKDWLSKKTISIRPASQDCQTGK